MSRSGLVTLLTDFGPGSVYVGQMHGVIHRLSPGARIVDLAHDCPPGVVAAASYILMRSYVHYPKGTVHVAVVDPGVGSSRAILAARADDHTFIAPDNGLLGGVLAGAETSEIRRVENKDLMNDPVSKTFHGRDIFAPVAARLAMGTPLTEVGPEAEAEIARPGPEIDGDGVTGTVLIVDRFGNLITDIPRPALQAIGEPSRIRVRVGAAFIDGMAQTFSDVPKGVALTYVGSGDHLEVAVNGGRASDLLGIKVGDPIRAEKRL